MTLELVNSRMGTMI